MKLLRLVVLLLFLFAVLPTCNSSTPSPEDIQNIQALRTELEELRSEIAVAEKKNASLAGSFVKALVEARLEVLRTTESLIQQRIHALESGATITVEVTGTQPNEELAKELEREIESQLTELKAAQEEAVKYSGGLVAAMKQAAVATQGQTVAMLRQRYLAAKYGLPTFFPSGVGGEEQEQEAVSGEPTALPLGIEELPAEVSREIVSVSLLRKHFAEQDYQEFLFFDVKFAAKGLDKPARAIKGVLHFQDLFGEVVMRINWTIDEPLKPGQTVMKKGTGFKYNKFVDEHQWVRTTKLQNMTVSFVVKCILYEDGSRRDF